MKASLFAAALLLATPLAVTGLAHAKPAAPRHYDCTKAGNANKAACKTVASAGTSSSAASSASSPLASVMPAKTRNYDCSKAGNANKTACKTAATVATAPTQPPAPVMTSKPPVSIPAATVAKAAVTPAPAGTPAGATAVCKDGTYSMSKHHSGSCSHHGGVKQWLS